MKTFACTLFALFATACGTSTNPGSSGPTLDQACSDLAQARCNKRSSCTGGGGITRTWGDMATCLSREKLSCTAGLSAPQTGNSPAAVEKCVAAYPSFSCTDFFANNPPAACIAVGPRANGAACAFAGQCASGYCDGNRTSLCGTCGPPPAVGDSCTTTNCAHGDECVSGTMLCETPGTLAGACGVGHPCGADLACVSSTCAATSATAGTSCGVGKPRCDGTQELFCGGPAGSKTCMATTFASGGSACGDLSNKSFVECADSGVCLTAAGTVAGGLESGTCQAAAADGAACDTQAGPPCLAPARCVTSGGGTSGTCTVPDGSKCG